jgi:NADH-quinone oxidoreductase subunit L
MTWPLIILAGFAVVLGFVGTPAWPWFDGFLTGEAASADLSRLRSGDFLALAFNSAVVVVIGLGLGWWLYGRKSPKSADEPDALERIRPDIFALLKHKYFVDELYGVTVVWFNRWWAWFADALDRWVFSGAVWLVSYLAVALAWVDRLFDEFVINLGFDSGCEALRRSGGVFSLLQSGRVQTYLRVMGVGVVVLILVLIWGRS